MSGLPLFLWAALVLQEPSRLVSQPEVSSALMEGDQKEMLAELERLTTRGVPGAEPVFRGFAALVATPGEANWTEACQIWEAASATSAEAAHFTAECYEHGSGVPEDLGRAVALYMQAGEAGFAKSLCAAGNLHIAGHGTQIDVARGVLLCRRGAEMGDADAQTDLANFYLMGEGVPEDHAEARRWYERAAAQNQRNAAFILGQMYWNGDAFGKDNAEALRLWRIAWDGGRKDAAELIAKAYMVQAMEDRDNISLEALEESVRWFDVALQQTGGPAERSCFDYIRTAAQNLIDSIKRNR